MRTRRFLLYMHAAEEALWDENRETFEGIAYEVAARYRLSSEDAELVAVAVRERLWEKIGNIAAASKPGTLARKVAYQASTEAAIALLPDERRLPLEERRARRRNGTSCARRNAPN